MFKKKKIILIILLILIGAGAAFYLSRSILVSERKSIYYDKYAKWYVLDFSKMTSVSEEEKAEYLKQLETWKTYLKSEKKDSLVKSFIGLAFLKKTTLDYKGAEQALIIAGEIDPNNTASFANLGTLYYYFLKDYPKGEEAYLKAIDNYPFFVDYYRDLGNLYQYQYNDIKKKEEILVRAVKNNPKDPDAFKLITLFYIEQKDKEKAVWYFDQLKTISAEQAALVEQEIEKL